MNAAAGRSPSTAENRALIQRISAAMDGTADSFAWDVLRQARDNIIDMDNEREDLKKNTQHAIVTGVFFRDGQLIVISGEFMFSVAELCQKGQLCGADAGELSYVLKYVQAAITGAVQ